MFRYINFLNSVYKDFSGEPWQVTDRRLQKSFVLSYNSNGYICKIEVPGFGKEHLKVTLEGKILKIVGDNGEDKLSETIHLELPDTAELVNPRVKLENGLLTVTFKNKMLKKSAAIELPIE